MSNYKELEDTINRLEARIKLLETFCQVVGPWVTPEQAAKLTPLTRRRIMAEIEIAEARRQQGKKYPLQYGVHYWNTLFPYEIEPDTQAIKDNSKATNRWKVHAEFFWQIVCKPLEERDIA
jgi:hypothetical protein